MAVRAALRRAYDLAALFSLLNLAALVIIAAIAFGTGAIDRARIARIAALLQGEAEVAPAAPSSADGSDTPPMPIPGPRETSAGPEDLEIRRRETDRLKTELEQQTALMNGMMLKITTDRDELRKERERMKAPPPPDLKQRREEGLKKQIEIFEQLTPKVALEHLLALSDMDQAARVLSELEPRKAKRIIEAAKTPEQSNRIQEILQRVQEVMPHRSAEFTAAEP
jgi:flagellar motility protein MotE (MotC chaperone)